MGWCRSEERCASQAPKPTPSAPLQNRNNQRKKLAGKRRLLKTRVTARYHSNRAMQHRHLTHQDYTLAAIDDIIDRGKRGDWEELAMAAIEDPSLYNKIARVCAAHISDPYAQRYFFWEHYVRRHTT